MNFDPAAFVTTLAAVGIVIVVATLISGVLDKRAVPAVGVFLLLGLLVGPAGLGLFDVSLRSAALGAIATIALTLVLFTDALGIDRNAIRRNLWLAGAVLGPGTLLSALLISGAAWWLLDLPIPLAAILGAALASTDPVMMRGLLRRPGVPAPARVALSVESGLNDVVVLPIVLVATAFLGPSLPSAGEVGRVALNVFLVGPAMGAAIGLGAVRSLEWMRGRIGLRRDYESLYVLGVAFAAYAAAETVHASGFMAAFSAGLVVALLDVELCDCFKDYGEATSEMFLRFSFVALGTSLIWAGLEALTPATLAFAAVALFGRSVVLRVATARLDPDSRRYVVWFGPRALSSLLLVLLPVFFGVSEAERLWPVAALVVLLSVAIHGGMLMAWQRQLGVRAPVTDSVLIKIGEYRNLVGTGARIRLLDVRATRAYEMDDLTATGSLRIDPDRPVESAAALALPKEDWLIAYCA
ncbi:MAG: cation:proton antiporter [Gemmatimonadales bacterium]|nr:cation:proton antiporter [Gemmatimonadales bacterium]